MKHMVETVDAGWMGRSFAADQDLTPLPQRPRLIPELVVLPFDDSGILFEGAETTEVLRGRSARMLLPRILPLLDGQRTLEEIAVSAAISRTALRDVVSLLFSRGLLEDGRAEISGSKPRADLMSFLGRYNDVSRSNRSRAEAYERLARARVEIVVPSVDAHSVASELADGLERSGVGTIRIVSVDRLGAAPTDLVVLIGARPDEDLAAAAAAARSAGITAFHFRIGATSAQVGPLFRTDAVACYPCFVRIHGTPAGVPRREVADFWTALATLQIFHLLSRLGKGSIHSGVRIYTDLATSDLDATAVVVPLTPGCDACGLGESAPVSPDEPAYLAWVYQTLARFPGRDHLSPKDYQHHYAVSNVKLAAEASGCFVGAPMIALPPPIVLRTNPWSPGPSVMPSSVLDVTHLATLLGRAGGFAIEDGNARRVAPSGGNLGSVDLLVVARAVEGLPAGAYFYNAARHALERVRDVDDAELRAALGTGGELPPCVVVAVGAMGKAQQKYAAFGYRLIHLDAGVTTTYLHVIAGAFGLAVREYPDLDLDTIAEIVGLPPSDSFVPTFAIGIGGAEPDASEPAARSRVPAVQRTHTRKDLGARVVFRLMEVAKAQAPVPARPASRTFARTARVTTPVTIESLEQVLLTRRARRSYADRPIDATIVRDLVAQAEHRWCARIAAGGPATPIRPLVVVRLGTPELPTGIYAGEDGELKLLREGVTLSEMQDLVVQNSLANSAIAVLFAADLDASLALRGPRGYAELALHAGAMATEVWLAATAYGLAACAAGGIAPVAVSRLSGRDGYRSCAMFGIFVGHPTGELATSR